MISYCDDAGAWLRRSGPRGDAGVTLVCFPHAGGAASYYLPLLRPLSPGLDVLVAEYPGRGDRWAERLVPTITELADRLADVLRAAGYQRVALFGHSMGALIAYEVALRMSRDGGPPEHLFVSGRRAPGRYRTGGIHELGDAALTAELRALGGTHDAVLNHPALVRMIMPAVRNDIHAAETYRHDPGHRLNCPVTALTGDRDPHASRSDSLAWRRLTTGRFDLRMFSGGHFYLASHHRAVAAVITGALAGVVMTGTANAA